MLTKLAYISVILALTNGSEKNENTSTTILTTTLTPLTTETTKTLNVSLLRITKPMVNTEPSVQGKSITTNENLRKSNVEKFIPSPQLETFIEYNRFVVQPPPLRVTSQHQELLKPAPTSNTIAQDKRSSFFYSKNDKYSNIDEKSNKSSVPSIITSGFSAPPAQDKQLMYLPYNDQQLKTEYPFNKFKFNDGYPYGSPSSSSNMLYPSSPTIDWYSKYSTEATPLVLAEHPYPFVSDFTKISMPAGHSLHPQKLTPNHFEIYKHPPPKMSSWQKAAKLFATILPIGILISALTPNILTISTVNNSASTQLCRKLVARAEDLDIDSKLIEKWSKPGCETRLLCETATRENHIDKETIKKLFLNFVNLNANDSETLEKFETVVKAIQEKQCDKIVC